MERAAVPSLVREQKLSQWIEQYANDIKKICYVYLADRSQAEDALQDTFLKAWKSMTAYERKNVTNDKAWLMRIAINVCRDYRKTAWFRHVDKGQDMDIVAAHTPAPLGQDRELVMDICNLPEKYKQVILLYYYQEMNMREVAQAVGIPASTVQRRLKKAAALLKAEWMGGEDDDP